MSRTSVRVSQFFSDPRCENEPYALPDAEVFQLTAQEVAEQDQDLLWEYLHKHEFRPLAAVGVAQAAE